MRPYYADDQATLYQADALIVLPTMPGQSVDLVTVDPPYNSGGRTQSDRTRDTPGASTSPATPSTPSPISPETTGTNEATSPGCHSSSPSATASATPGRACWYSPTGGNSQPPPTRSKQVGGSGAE
jgi:hypothetical protein